MLRYQRGKSRCSGGGRLVWHIRYYWLHHLGGLGNEYWLANNCWNSKCEQTCIVIVKYALSIMASTLRHRIAPVVTAVAEACDSSSPERVFFAANWRLRRDFVPAAICSSRKNFLIRNHHRHLQIPCSKSRENENEGLAVSTRTTHPYYPIIKVR